MTLLHQPQVAALPVRLGSAGLELMLITSRETGRWLVPKGWPMKGIKDFKAAAREALEEAGVRGRIAKHPLGAYTYQKRLPSGTLPCRVMVYRLDVETELDVWREQGQRIRHWFSPSEAASLVSEPGLSAIIQKVVMSVVGASPHERRDAPARSA